MYVCICNAISDRDIRKAAARGADSLDALTMTLGVGAGCGSCRELAEQVLSECAHRSSCTRPCAASAQRQGLALPENARA